MAGPGQARFYSSTAIQTQLAAGISAGTTTFNVGSVAGYPSSTPFAICVDQNLAGEELMLVTNVSGVQFTVTRGIGGTSAVLHNNGANVTHVVYSQDMTDAGVHVGSYDNVHGLSVGSLVVGTTDTQTLTNKTLTSPTINTPTLVGSGGTLTLPAGPDTLVGRATTDTLTNKTLTNPVIANIVSGSGTLTVNTSGTVTVPNGTDTLVGLALTQTLTNKTLTTPVIASIHSSSGALTVNTSGTMTVPNGTDTLVGLALTQTLTNKTLTSPTINAPSTTDIAASNSATTTVPLNINALTSTTADLFKVQTNGTQWWHVTSGGNLKAENGSQLDLSNGTNTQPFLGPASNTYAVTWTAFSTNPTLGNGTLTGRYIRYGKLVWFSIYLTWGSTTTAGTGAWEFTLPVAPLHGAETTFCASMLTNSLWYSGSTQFNSGSTFFTYPTTNSTNGVGVGVPNTWNTGSTFQVSGWYESA